MNLKRRLRISWVAVWVIRVPFRCWWLIAHLMAIPCFLTIALMKMKCNYRVEVWKKASASWTARANSLCAECYATSQAGEGHTEVSRQRLLATQSVLLAEHERLQEAAAELKSDGGSGVMTYMLVSVQDGIFRSARKRKAFLRILSQIENSPTFYWDLLLWFVTPSLNSLFMLCTYLSARRCASVVCASSNSPLLCAQRMYRWIPGPSTGWHFDWIDWRASANETLGICTMNSPCCARSSNLTASGTLW